VTVSRTKLTFPTPGNWRYRIEISENGESWKSLVDQTTSASASAERSDSVSNGSASGHIVRISIVESPANQPAALAEVEVFGSQTGR